MFVALTGARRTAPVMGEMRLLTYFKEVTCDDNKVRDFG